MIRDLLVPNIALVGFMGAGKSTVGRRLARCTGLVFRDLDEEIERGEGMSVEEIFARRGEAYFRERERMAFEAVCSESGQVIACGGGTFLDPRNRETRKRRCFSVWLRATPEEILRRVERPGAPRRPLLEGVPAAQVIPEMLRAREATYEEADLAIDTDGRGVREIAEEIRLALRLPLAEES